MNRPEDLAIPDEHDGSIQSDYSIQGTMLLLSRCSFFDVSNGDRWDVGIAQMGRCQCFVSNTANSIFLHVGCHSMVTQNLFNLSLPPVINEYDKVQLTVH